MSSIGEVAQQLGLSTHTLRYYEKIGLLAPVAKTTGGRREYGSTDIQRVQFIKRAQRMHFSLDEIRTLIELDKADAVEKPQVQRLVKEKLDAIDESLTDLQQLKVDLAQMLSACLSSGEAEDCPIIEGIKQPKLPN
ncbi:MAG: DNA-binding transcriptional MerR regulator [Cryomorphaceae bacterium]|jgi:DNA-binding transcriptional MerR regulator